MERPQHAAAPAGHGRPPKAQAHRAAEQQKYTKVPDEWHIELPGRGADRGSADHYFGGCRSIERGYTRGEVLGHGTYGEVYLAVDKETNDKVAAKKIKMDNEKEGFPITAIREIKILSALANTKEEIAGAPLRNNVITLREIVRSDAHSANDRKGSIYMVFDYMDHDLAGLLERQLSSGSKFLVAQAKTYVRQLLFGLALLQHKKVLHRDLKNANLLVNNRGELKIADFGLARYMQQRGQDGLLDRRMTNRVITLWYRPPELLLGAEHYGSEIDIWSAGCIMAELLMDHPHPSTVAPPSQISKALFAGSDEGNQADKIFRVVGRPTEATMPGCTSYDNYKNFNFTPYPAFTKLRTHLQSRGVTDLLALDLLERMLCLDPAKRINARDAAMHQWFYTHPLPMTPEEMPQYQPSHEMNMKKRRQEAARGGGHASQQRHHPQQQHQGGPPPAQRQRTHGQYGGGGAQGGAGGAPAAQPQYGQAPAHYPAGSRGGAPAAAAAGMHGPAPPYGGPGMPPAILGVISSDQIRHQQRQAMMTGGPMGAQRGAHGAMPPPGQHGMPPPGGQYRGPPSAQGMPPPGYGGSGAYPGQQGGYGGGRSGQVPPGAQQSWQTQRR
eukprot:scaffold16.g9.t1